MGVGGRRLLGVGVDGWVGECVGVGVTGGAELLVGGEQDLDVRDALLREPVAGLRHGMALWYHPRVSQPARALGPRASPAKKSVMIKVVSHNTSL